MAEPYRNFLRDSPPGLGPTLLRGFLRLASVPYGWGIRGRNWMFDRGWRRSFAAAVPVVSVGNLTVGGTGKTPCVEYVARFFRDLDLRVAILSRGYGSETGRNDEALVLEDNLPDVPHLQGPNRVQLAATAVEELDSEILVLDDGFQHRRLRRDLDLVLIDATCPWGFGHVLPRGLLREPISGLRRAQAAVLTRCDQVETSTLEEIRRTIQRVAPKLPIVETTHRPTVWINSQAAEQPLDAWRGRPIAAFCGLGNPDGFRRSLEALGYGVPAWRTFPDHHAYTREDVEDLRGWARQQRRDAVLATTQKDLVKLRIDRLGDLDLWALKIQLQVTAGEDVLQTLLRGVLERRG